MLLCLLPKATRACRCCRPRCHACRRSRIITGAPLLDRMVDVSKEDSVRKMSLNLEKVSVAGSIKRMLNEADRDGDGRLSVAEVIAVVEKAAAEREEKD